MPEESSKRVSRRGALKWAGALAAVGLVGVGLGVGGDILIRPNTTSTATETSLSTATKMETQTAVVTQPPITQTATMTQTATATQIQTQTATQTATATVTQPAVTQTATQTATQTTTKTQSVTQMSTTTVTAPPTTLSYVPPLSPVVQTRVNQIVTDMVTAHSGETIKYTTCSGTQCMRYCILGVRIKNGAITGFIPDNTINPNIAMEDKYLDQKTVLNIDVQSRVCPMAYGFKKLIYDPNRVIYPMQKIGARGSGQWQRISMSQAISLTAQWLQDTKNTYGPYSIWHESYSCLGHSSFPLANWFNAGMAGWDCHSTNGWSQPSNWVGVEGGSTDYKNMSMSKLIILWANNPVVIQQGEWGWYLRMFREQGIPIICIDHRYTWSAESVASQFIPIRPGTDAALALALANVLFKQNLWNQTFVNQWVESTGFAAWQGYVLGQSAGPDGAIDRTPQWAEAICGVPAQTITELAQLYAKSSPGVCLCSGGSWRSIFGENIARGQMYLQAMTGNMGVVGACLTTYSGPSGSAVDYNGKAAVAPNVNLQRAVATYTPPIKFAEMCWAKAIVLYQQMQAGQITKDWYYGKVGLKYGNTPANIQMLVFENNNMVTTVDVNTSLSAIQNVGHIVTFTQDYRESAKWSDLLIPQAYMQFEGRQPSVGNSRMSAGQPDVLFRSVGKHWFYLQKCIDGPGDVQSEDYVWTQIGNVLGIGNLFNPLFYQATSEAQWDQLQEQVHQATYQAWAATDGVKQYNPPSWTDFQKKPIWRWPNLYTPRFQGQDTIAATPATSPFATASKKVEFVSPYLSQGPQWLANNDYYPVGSGMSYGAGNLAPMAEWQSGAGDAMHSPDTSNYPILITTPHSHYRQHSWLDNNPVLQDNYRHAVWLSVADAQKRDIIDGDLVHVYNTQGEMVVPAYVTSRLVPGTGVIFEASYYVPSTTTTPLMPHGIDLRGSCNFLDRDIDLPYTVVGYYNCHALVQVELYRGPPLMVAGATSP